MMTEEAIELQKKEMEEIWSIIDNKVYYIDEIMTSKKKYKDTVEEMYDYIKAGFEIKEHRERLVHFKFRREDADIISLQLRHFLVNIMIWEAFMKLECISEMNICHIFDCVNITPRTLYAYINNMIIAPNRQRIDNKKINRTLESVIFNLSRISTDFNIILGISINIDSFIDLAKKNERYNELINTKIPDDLQPNEIEAELNSRMHEMIEIMKVEENCMQPMLLAEAGVKDMQLREFAINGGLKPDLFGNTIPIAINGNLLVGGLANAKHYFIDALGGNKSMIMNKTEMGRSGHFATMVILLTSSVKFSHEEDCGTVNPIKINITDRAMLSRFIGRNYKLSGLDVNYKTIKDSNEDIIGKDIFLRSPCTCASKDGVCKTCYGDLYHINKDLESPGAYSAIKLTMPVSQDILSSKHLLATFSIKIEFDEIFDEFFKISGNHIVLTDDEDIDLSEYELVIKDEDLQKISEYDENRYNHYIKKFYVRNIDTDELIEINEIQGNELFIDKDVYKSLKKSKDERRIRLDNIDAESIFVVEIKNNELTKPLYDIMGLLDKKTDINVANRGSIAQMLNEMIRLMKKSKIGLGSIHAEMIMYSLIRKSNDILERPSFARYGVEYDIITVKDALEKHSSPVIGISFQHLKRQLTKSGLTYEKYNTSVFDEMFKPLK